MSRVVLITGCSSGIGRATARRFAAEGWTVYATAREEGDLAGLADRGCRTAELDVTDGPQVASVVDAVREETGRVDCLVNNAGRITVGALEELPAEAVHEQFDVNVYGPHRLARAVAPHMRDRGAGRIVTVGSVAGRFPVPGMGAYNASKFALRGLTATLRDELRRFGVAVSLVEPTFVDTPMLERQAAAADGREDSPYADLYARYARYTREEMADALSPDRVAETVHTAATAADPRARYPVGLRSRVEGALGALPAGLRYWLWRRVAVGD